MLECDPCKTYRRSAARDRFMPDFIGFWPPSGEFIATAASEWQDYSNGHCCRALTRLQFLAHFRDGRALRSGTQYWRLSARLQRQSALPRKPRACKSRRRRQRNAIHKQRRRSPRRSVSLPRQESALSSQRLLSLLQARSTPR